ncbi:hypothetical protein F4780DRAFT_457543 [Xylariomycetidae sp. FL0641]|nr:hypothetical protein F4780DRAFT_457543 [Xylariomycetidae sp. FL0641]
MGLRPLLFTRWSLFPSFQLLHYPDRVLAIFAPPKLATLEGVLLRLAGAATVLRNSGPPPPLSWLLTDRARPKTHPPRAATGRTTPNPISFQTCDSGHNGQTPSHSRRTVAGRKPPVFRRPGFPFFTCSAPDEARRGGATVAFPWRRHLFRSSTSSDVAPSRITIFLIS